MGRFPELLTGLFRDFRDSYNKGRVKMDTDLDKAMGDSSNALTKATTAETNSTDAKNTANSVQTQLNNIVIESGTSDAETLQARGTFPVLNDRLNNTESELLQNENEISFAKRKQKYFDIVEDYGADPKGIIDSSDAIENAIKDAAYHAKLNVTTFTCVVKIPAGFFKITRTISVAMTRGIHLVGDTQNTSVFVPTLALVEGEFVFNFHAENFQGSSIFGLQMRSFRIDMKNTKAHAMKLSSLHTFTSFDSVEIRDVFGHGVYFAAKDKASDITYECVEAVTFDKVYITGVQRKEGDPESRYSLVMSDEVAGGSINQLHDEIKFYSCRFYPNPHSQRITSDNMTTMNRRSAIEVATYSVGWGINECMFNSVYGAPAIKFGERKNGTKVTSRGHRIYSNDFENIGQHQRPTTPDNTWYKQNCVIYMTGAPEDYAFAQNNIFMNRFEKPIMNDCVYFIDMSGTNIYENALSPKEIILTKGMNTVFAFGSMNKDGNNIIGDQFKNVIVESQGEQQLITSALLAISRNDVGLNQNSATKPTIGAGHMVNGSLNNAFKLKLENETYQASRLGVYFDNDILAKFIFRKNGAFKLTEIDDINYVGEHGMFAMRNGEPYFRTATGWKKVILEA
ncbi:glycoside hydrolase family 55 protein [Metabacillus litoralis]|uniref:glycoside hydrolase family 55 protein n=1 Tax=Metabacillus litoralis TaxID=152268 RepID=UPI00203FC0F2|nr:glycoside hydrolase family 55 protein [Metabacillus litoralis]MCM3651336.1 glycoside hydrolase family 55 protein [Metabacillus litoralis]